MAREVITVDVDEVVFPFLGQFILDYNPRYDADLKPEDFTTYEFENHLGLTLDETVRRLRTFTGMDHDNIEPIEGSVEAIGRLATKYDLEIITARHPDFEINTVRWLQQKLGHEFKGINAIGYAPVMDRPLTKAEVCLKIGAIAHIDDSLRHSTEVAEVGIEAVLFGDYLWNQAEILPTGVVRIPDWPAVAEHFNV